MLTTVDMDHLKIKVTSTTTENLTDEKLLILSNLSNRSNSVWHIPRTLPIPKALLTVDQVLVPLSISYDIGIHSV